jgi:hypothetical protein
MNRAPLGIDLDNCTKEEYERAYKEQKEQAEAERGRRSKETSILRI